MRAGDEIAEVQRDHAGQPDEQRVDGSLLFRSGTDPAGNAPEPEGEHHSHPDHERPVRGGAPVATEVERTRQVGGVEVPEQPERAEDEPFTTSARAIDQHRADRERTGHADDHAHRGTDQAVAEGAVGVGVDERLDAIAE